MPTATGKVNEVLLEVGEQKWHLCESEVSAPSAHVNLGVLHMEIQSRDVGVRIMSNAHRAFTWHS